MQSIAATIKQLQRMSVGELRQKWEEVFGEPCRSFNKDYLWKRIAWRVQVNAEGGLSDRAKERIKELAREADIRLRPPTGVFGENRGGPSGSKTLLAEPGRRRDLRLPVPGTVITREYHGHLIAVTVKEDGFEYEGRPYRSLSAITKAITGSQWSGFLFFNLNGHNGKRVVS